MAPRLQSSQAEEELSISAAVQEQLYRLVFSA